MAKKPQAVKAATIDKSIAKTAARKKARLARHAKNQPNDLQSVNGFKNTPRKKPHTKGNFAAKVVRLVHAVTGQPLQPFPQFKAPYAVAK